jgi:hypothetical protein
LYLAAGCLGCVSAAGAMGAGSMVGIHARRAAVEE